MLLSTQLYIYLIMMDQDGSDMTNVDILIQDILLNNGRLWYKKQVSRQNGSQCLDHILKLIFPHEKCVILKVRISLIYDLSALINNNPALLQVMAWCWIDDKPLSEPLML